MESDDSDDEIVIRRHPNQPNQQHNQPQVPNNPDHPDQPPVHVNLVQFDPNIIQDPVVQINLDPIMAQMEHLRWGDFLPKPFEDGQDCIGFLTKLQDYIDIHQVQAAHQVSVFKACLSPKVRAWLDTLPEGERDTYDHCVESFKKRFLGVSTRESAMAQFNAAKLEASETIGQFHKRIKQYAEFFDMDDNEDYIKQKLLDSMPPNVRELLILTGEDLNENDLVARLSKYMLTKNTLGLSTPWNTTQTMATTANPPVNGSQQIDGNLEKLFSTFQSKNQSTQPSTSKSQTTKGCFKCGSETHWANECALHKGLEQIQNKLEDQLKNSLAKMTSDFQQMLKNTSRSRSSSRTSSHSRSTSRESKNSSRSGDKSRSRSTKRDSRSASRSSASKSAERNKSASNVFATYPIPPGMQYPVMAPPMYMPPPWSYPNIVQGPAHNNQIPQNGTQTTSETPVSNPTSKNE